MFKWWKRNKSKHIPMSISNDTMTSSDVPDKTKKNRSLVSFFIDKQQISDRHLNRITVEDDSVLQTRQPTSSIDLSQQKRDPNFKSSMYRNTQMNLDEYLQLFDEIINSNNSCFGFSLSQIPSKYCLYMSIIIFLGICLIISLTAILKR